MFKMAMGQDVTVVLVASPGSITASSNNTSVVTASVSGTSVVLSPVGTGTAKVTINYRSGPGGASVAVELPIQV